MMLGSLIQGLQKLRQQRGSFGRLPGGPVPLDLAGDVFKSLLPLDIPLAPLQGSTYVLCGRFDYGNGHHLIKNLAIIANSAHRVKRSQRGLAERGRTCYKACYNLSASESAVVAYELYL